MRWSSSGWEWVRLRLMTSSESTFRVTLKSSSAAPTLRAFGNQFFSTKLTQPIAALPLQVFVYAISPYDEWHAQAWAGALVLIALVLVISVISRFVVRSRHGQAND